jgi:Ran-binding protein 3
VTTGEEDEYTVHTVKAKLLVIDGSSENWKERGTGTLRINTKKTDGNTATPLVMRADSVFRVILNVPLFAGMKVWIMQEKFVRFAGFETVEPSESAEKKDETVGSTKLVNYALKVTVNVCVDKYNVSVANIPSSLGGQLKLSTGSL